MFNIAEELGVVTLAKAGPDVLLIIVLRMIRLLAFGITTLILVLFLAETGMSHANIGYFMTLTFLGDLISSFVFSILADGLGRRATLIISSFIMAATGVAFAMFSNPVVLTAVAILGILTPGGGEVGPFRSIEQSSLATLAEHEARSDVYAWYTFLGFFCSALGSFLCGTGLDYLELHGYTVIESYRAVFWAYAILGVICGVLGVALSSKMELGHEGKSSATSGNTNEAVQSGDVPNAAGSVSEGTSTELRPEEEAISSLEANPHAELLKTDQPPTSEMSPLLQNSKTLVPGLNRDILAIVIKLSILFGLDAFASSLVQGTWLTYYIKHKFEVSATTLGLIFFVTNNIAGFCSLFSTSLTKRIGPVATMVVTHLPASLLLVVLPLPSSLVVTLCILFVRASTQSMDVAPKHVFLATLVPPEFRTTVFAWTNIVKTTGLMFGPSITGYLTGIGLQWITFVMAGSLKMTYDLGILATFMSYNRHHVH